MPRSSRPQRKRQSHGKSSLQHNKLIKEFLRDQDDKKLTSLNKLLKEFYEQHPDLSKNTDIRSRFRGAFYKERRQRLWPYGNWEPEWPFDFTTYFPEGLSREVKALFQHHRIPVDLAKETHHKLAELEHPLLRYLLLYFQWRGTSLERFGLTYLTPFTDQELRQLCQQTLEDPPLNDGDNHRMASSTLLFLKCDDTPTTPEPDQDTE